MRLPDAAAWLKDCALIAGEDGDWAMCHVGEEYRHLSLCSEKVSLLRRKQFFCGALNYPKFGSLGGAPSTLSLHLSLSRVCYRDGKMSECRHLSTPLCVKNLPH